MKRLRCLYSPLGLCVAQHVHGNGGIDTQTVEVRWKHSTTDRIACDRILHLVGGVRGTRGGSFESNVYNLLAASRTRNTYPTSEAAYLGFRVAAGPQPAGACCDWASFTCQNNVLEDYCDGLDEEWTEGTLCADLDPPCLPPGMCLANELAKLVALDGDHFDYFGHSVGVSGDTAVIGAKYDDDNGDDSGSAYIFRFDGANWVEEAKLLPSDGETDDWFGKSVAIDGDTAVIGAHESAFVFQFEGSSWLQKAILLASDGAAGDQFGWSVAISGDTALIGAPNGENNGIPTGSAYVVTDPDGGWEYVPYPIYEDAKLTASDGAADDWFGSSVAISGDAAVIGAAYDDDSGTDSGSAYVFGGLSDCNNNDTLDICDIADGTSPDCNSNAVPDECAAGMRSCREHDVAGRLCLDMGARGGVEPRVGRITELEIDLDDASGVTQVVGVYCEDVSTNQVPWGGAVPFAVTSGGGDTVIAQFSPALPDQAYCLITLDCGAEVCVRMCEGDMNRGGATNTTDASAVKARFGATATEANCEWDFNCSGAINTTDYSACKARFGKTAPDCP